jgi:AhpD family alkylhydroperoxidase
MTDAHATVPTHYCHPDDARLAPELIRLAPIEAHAFLRFKETAERADGVIPPKFRELISVAVALTTQCAYCLDVHTRLARERGASREELAEVVFIAGALRAGAAIGHGLLALRLFDRELEPKSGRKSESNSVSE